MQPDSRVLPRTPSALRSTYARATLLAKAAQLAQIAQLAHAAIIIIVAMITVLGLGPARASAQSGPPPVRNDSAATAEGLNLRVFLATMEPGAQIWEKFGHDAIWIQDARTGHTQSYDYGVFSFNQPNFILNFLRGQMLYGMGYKSAEAVVQDYRWANRTINVQELNFTPAQKTSLRDFLEWNVQPQNAEYPYDYFKDNCATRLRDAIDRVTGGQVKTALRAKPAGTTYRWQARRMLADEELAYAGIELGLANPTDEPLSAWEDSFLPGNLMAHLRTVTLRTDDGRTVPLVTAEEVIYRSTRVAPREAPPNRTLLFTATGIALGVMLMLLGRLASLGSRAARVAFGIAGFVWCFAVGAFGKVIMLLWIATHHTATYRNENVLQANIVSLVLAFVVVLLVWRTGRRTDDPIRNAKLRRTTRLAVRLAAAVAALAALGFVLQVLPGFDQVNGEIIGLMLPAHLGLLAGISTFVDRSSA